MLLQSRQAVGKLIPCICITLSSWIGSTITMHCAAQPLVPNCKTQRSHVSCSHTPHCSITRITLCTEPREFLFVLVWVTYLRCSSPLCAYVSNCLSGSSKPPPTCADGLVSMNAQDANRLKRKRHRAAAYEFGVSVGNMLHTMTGAGSERFHSSEERPLVVSTHASNKKQS